MAKHLDLDGNVQGERNEYLGLHREKNCGCPNCGGSYGDLFRTVELSDAVVKARADLVRVEAEFYRYMEDVLSEDEVG
jgi:hypothetical protein